MGLRPKLPSPLVALDDERLDQNEVRLLLKRDDLIHSALPGNKWRKLAPNLNAARESGHTALLTFGGAHSHHVRATAAVGYHLGLRTRAAIAGPAPDTLTDALADASGHGMELTYLDEATYHHRDDPDVLATVTGDFGPCYVLPEGGSNALGVRGCAELPGEIAAEFTTLCCACGTGGTLAGVAAGLSAGHHALGFPMHGDSSVLAERVAKLQQEAFGETTENWSLQSDFGFGDVAPQGTELEEFIADFRIRHHLALERLYVAKLLYGVLTLVERGEFARGTTLVAVMSE